MKPDSKILGMCLYLSFFIGTLETKLLTGLSKIIITTVTKIITSYVLILSSLCGNFTDSIQIQNSPAQKAALHHPVFMVKTGL